MLKPLVALLSLLPLAANAIPIMGIEDLPDTTSIITFNDATLPNFSPVTDEFLNEGATFAGLFYDDGFSPRANTDGALLGQFGRDVTASLLFNNAVNRAAFAFSSNAGNATFTSFLAGVLVESFTADISGTAFIPADPLRRPNVFGFEESLFDEIVLTTGGNSTGFSLDNVSFDEAEVPAPATLALFGLGLAGIGYSRRKKA